MTTILTVKTAGYIFVRWGHIRATLLGHSVECGAIWPGYVVAVLEQLSKLYVQTGLLQSLYYCTAQLLDNSIATTHSS